jgi:membrane-bound ClpP family serine protease
MGLLLFLIVLGILFLVAELVLLPGLSFGGILAVVCEGGAIYMAFNRYGAMGGWLTILLILVLGLVAVVISLRTKTWQRLSLKQQIDSTTTPSPTNEVSIGMRGTTVSRLAPMGKVCIEGRYYEAKSLDVYIDQHCEVEVVGFENFNIVVRKA